MKPEKDKTSEQLREELKDYYGTAMMNGFAMAMYELDEIDRLTDEELEEKTREIGLD